MSMAGIAGASAADVGNAQTQYGNHYTVQKITKVHAKQLKYVKKQTKTHKKVFKKFKRVKKTASSKKRITRNVNKSKSVIKRERHRIYKHYRSHSKHKKVHRVKRSTRANSSSIKSLARSLTRGTHSQYQKGTKVFNWVKTHVRYRFYKNTRYGASGTLRYKKGNCADQAHLVVALARASGVPARYVHAKAHFRSGHWYGHVWAQLRVNGRWITADTTSKRNSFGVVRNWNSARIKGIYNRLPF